MKGRIDCPNCGSRGTEEIYEVADVPVNSVLLIDEREKSMNFPRGDILLRYCTKCSFIFNSKYNPSASIYSKEYEGTQSFSDTYRRFLIKLADRLVKDLSTHNKKILEIGCGQGEFLELLCIRGNNIGLGFDPSYRGDMIKEGIKFVSDFYSENHSDIECDLIVCKMTLEHIPETKRFVSMIRRNIGQNETKVFFQLPNVEKILSDLAFWDIYYEHCSYFCADSLCYLLESTGFRVINQWASYNNQYLLITAEPKNETEHDLNRKNSCGGKLDKFRKEIYLNIDKWKRFFNENKDKKLIIWGGSSKAVAFITTLRVEDEIDLVVDVNPNKNNTFLPGTGHLVVNPLYLKDFPPPDILIIMNPIYKDEIIMELDRIGLNPKVITV